MARLITDEALLEAARAGDRGALDTLLARHQDRVYRYGMRVCRQREDAEDVLQDTLLAVARSIREFRGASSFSTWLYSIAHNACARKRRRRKDEPARTAPLDDAAGLPDAAKTPEQASAERELADALEAAIAGLEPMYREVLLLRDGEGLTAPEVGEVLGLGVPAVKTRLHRARKAVREAVAARLGVPDAPSAEGCPDIVDLLSRKLEDEIDAEVCARMEVHVEGCPRCRARCDTLRSALAMCRAAPAPRVPREVQDAVREAIRQALG